MTVGILFFLIVGRMFWDSFKYLFADLLIVILPSFLLIIITEDLELHEGMWQMILLISGSVAAAVWVYFKLSADSLSSSPHQVSKMLNYMMTLL